MRFLLKRTWKSLKAFYHRHEKSLSFVSSLIQFIGPLLATTIKQRVAAAALSLSAIGLIGIVNQEDFTLKAYKDEVGVPTIGPGLTKGVKMGDTITVRQGLARLSKEVKDEYEAAVHRCAPVPMYQNEYDIFTRVTWNIGPGAFCSSTMARRLNEGDYPGACEAIKMFNKITVNGKKVVSRGLSNLRETQYAECMRAPD